ncbi:fatty acyl-AMP ligase [Mycobacterium antarcticum]|uniref:fatty acyl-AMP ligase n=1 Tax=Mycolicibacterium sp. TUM20984 TaxID=3023368 RepID=UPI0023869266|nr:fatty acyl-AMP ligase [Mycolicibacterium sp. TUM20984]GLP81058.1 nitrate ABC transporter substrate-binding protein [Mycolicibacterium sp. TUM20984]
MSRGPQQEYLAPRGLLRIEDCLTPDGGVALPPGVTLSSLIDRNIAHVGDAVAYRYLDFTRADQGQALELTWGQLGVRMRAIGAHLQSVASRGDRVAILAPQGLDYVAGFFASIKSGNIAVPLFAPELPGHAERLDTALRDSRPAVVLVTAAVLESVESFLDTLPRAQRPQIAVIDRIADADGDGFVPVDVDVDDISHLQYTSGSTRPPVGVEITHRAVGTNLIQMILSIDLLNRNTHGVSWLPLYHDMGLSMIGFPAVYGGHSTLMSPTAFIRRPQRWIRALSDGSRRGNVVTAAPNFAYEWTAQRGLPAPGDDVDLSNVVLIIGSEPVSIEAITLFNQAFAPHGLRPTAIKPSYGIAEATLFISTTAPTAEATVVYFDRDRLAAGQAVAVAPDTPYAVGHVSLGQVARSEWAVVVDPETGAELPDGQVGEMWLYGNNIGRGYWGLPEETRRTFGAKLLSRQPSGSHAGGVPSEANWLRTGDLGFHLDGELFITGRIADHIVIDGRNFYPQDVEATAADASSTVRRGYVAAFPIPTADGERLVVIAERAAGSSRADPAAALDAIRSEVLHHHGLSLHDVKILPAGAIPRTTSGKLARRACRAEYLAGAWA